MSDFKKIVSFLKPVRIRTQLILGIAAVHLALMAVFVFDMLRKQELFLIAQNKTQTINLASNFAVNSAPYIISNDFYTLERITQSYKNFPYLKYAMVTTPDGMVLAHSEKKHVGTMLTDKISKSIKPVLEPQVLVNDKNILDVAVPVQNKKEIVGWVRLGIRQDFIYTNLSSIEKNGLLYISIAIILGSVFALIIGNYLSRNLYRLIAAADEIRKGNREKRIENLKGFEISKLSDALNKMLDDIVSNETLLNNILENMPVGVWLMDAEGMLVSSNPAAQKIWGGTKHIGNQEFGLSKGKFVHNGKEVEADEWAGAVAVKENKAVLDQEIELECFDGTHKVIINSAIPIKNKNGQRIGVLNINVDITDRKKMENEREDMVKDLMQRNQDLEQFSYIVSHNIRGPLSTFLALSNLLDYGNPEEDFKFLTDSMKQQALKLDEVIRDMNTVLDVKKGLLQPKVPIRFADVVENVTADLQVMIQSSNARIDFDFKACDSILSIKSYIQNIFWNLISNSIKYKSPERNPEITIRSEIKDSNLILYFKDNGIGIDMTKNKHKLFNFYKRFDFSAEGKGIGLFMVKIQINTLGGTIEVESELNKGTTFTIVLPLT